MPGGAQFEMRALGGTGIRIKRTPAALSWVSKSAIASSGSPLATIGELGPAWGLGTVPQNFLSSKKRNSERRKSQPSVPSSTGKGEDEKEGAEEEGADLADGVAALLRSKMQKVRLLSRAGTTRWGHMPSQRLKPPVFISDSFTRNITLT